MRPGMRIGIWCGRQHLTYVVDPGIAVHPDQVIAQIQSGAVSGLINTFRSKITLEDGRIQQSNFNDFPLLLGRRALIAGAR
jgi:CO/xanthine dehydrogenase Mo-binding subunit